MVTVSDDKLRQVRVLHFVSSGGVTGAMQQALFMPLLTRMPKQRVKAQVVSLAPGFTPGAVLRQSGIPVHEVSLSKRRFATGALKELLNTTRQFRPDVIQAWGHTAQLAALFVRSRCDWKPKVVWSIADTAPIAKKAGLIDRRKLKLTAKHSRKADRIVYTSEAAASLHRRCGYPETEHVVISPGVDPTRFKPDFAARRRVREQLGVAADAFVIGMAAPFQTEYDHVTLLKGVGELIKTNPNLSVILAGHGVQKGNAPLMALVGGGTLGTRTHLVGEWSDTAAFFNACDVACSSSLTDSARMTLVMAMLCGVPCVATGMGAQGEVLGKFGVAIEPNSPAAFIRGITRVMQMPEDRRAAMIQGARKHALANFASVRSLQKYLQLYFDVVGRQALAEVPTPEIDPSIPAPPADLHSSSANAAKAKAAKSALVALHELSDPDSLEAQVREIPMAYQPPPPPPPRVESRPASEGDVLQIFESSLTRKSDSPAASPMAERARGVAEDLGDLLTPEELQAATAVAASVRPPEPKSPPPVTLVVRAATPVAAVQDVVKVATVEAPRASPTTPARPPELNIVSRAPKIWPTPVQLPMLPQEGSEVAAAVAPVESTMQLELLPDLPEERRPAVAASG
jgi:glycosyltransferase involved in cell wall biosynthesis